ncbi:MAG: FAD-dependent oxidoreductase [Rubrobacter sp.]|nr:FAD-dependent oxidoreductase [Rubrobacter sp.]
MNSCIIIGAGLSGLITAQTLQNAGITVTVLEREQKIGGRMRTDRVQNGVFDHGAQFFTVRSDRFEEITQTWLSAGVAQEWTRGFADATGEQNEDGHPRYKGTRGMTAITEYLAQDLDIRTGLEVKELHETGQSWEVVAGSSTHDADALILTAPAPAALALVDSNGISLPSEAREALQSISYQPCIAVMALLDGPGEVPRPGGVQVGGDPLFWIADNYQKGISEVPAVTIHAGPEWSREHAQSDDARVSDLLLQEAKDYLGTGVRATAVYRWEYSMPASSYEEQFIYVEGPPPLVFCGDAYAGPKVEGATLSGLAAAEKLLETR